MEKSYLRKFNEWRFGHEIRYGQKLKVVYLPKGNERGWDDYSGFDCSVGDWVKVDDFSAGSVLTSSGNPLPYFSFESKGKKAKVSILSNSLVAVFFPTRLSLYYCGDFVDMLNIKQLDKALNGQLKTIGFYDVHYNNNPIEGRFIKVGCQRVSRRLLSRIRKHWSE